MRKLIVLGLVLGAFLVTNTLLANPSNSFDKPPVNEWVKVDEGITGARYEPGLVYLPKEGRFLLFGGSMRHEERPYDEMTFDPGSGKWANRFPRGKENVWGSAVGNVKTPHFERREYFGIGDIEGNPRYNVYGHMQSYYQYAYDSDSKRVYVYLWNHTASYDPEKRIWKHLDAKNPPGGGPKGPHAIWGSMCYIPDTKEVLFSGAGHFENPNGYSGTWTYSAGANEWKKLEFGSKLINRYRLQIENLRKQAQHLVAACRNRFYVSQSPEGAKLDPGDSASILAADIATEAAGIRAATGGDEYERVQLEHAHQMLDPAVAKTRKLKEGLKGTIDAEVIAQAYAIEEALRHARDALAVEPPPRCMAPLAYDRVNKKVVLFGGDGHARFYADTWVFEPKARRWYQMRPPLSPSPRAGHALVWLPKSKSLVLVGRGYRPLQTPPRSRGEWTEVAMAPYETLPFEMWKYDVAGNRWTLIRRYEGDDAPPASMHRSDTSVFAAAGNDLVVGIGRKGFWTPKPNTWVCKLDPSVQDAAGTAKFGVAPGTEVYHIGPNDPATYDREAGTAPKVTEENLGSLPANTWIYLAPPNIPATRNGGTWGTCILDPAGDQFLWWAGGHSSYCGNEVVHYSIKTNRWNYSYRPGHSLNWVASNNGGPGLRDFDGHPWMCMHPYRWYAYDPVCKRLVYLQSRTYTYDPVRREWDRQSYETPAIGNMVTTPRGVMAAARARDYKTHLYRFEMGKGWTDLPLKGEIPWPCKHGTTLIYDSSRDRVLLVGKGYEQIPHGEVIAYDMKTGKVTFLKPRNAEKLPEVGIEGMRESIYLPEHDLVLFAGYRKKGGVVDSTLVYDMGKNEWQAARFKPPLPGMKKDTDRYSLTPMGLMYHPVRKLIFAVVSHGYRSGYVYVLRFDPETAEFVELE